jgi:methionyl-tRNA formyltransferase
MSEPAVKAAARELGLPINQPVKVKTGTLHEWLAERRPDVAIVLAYGRILPPLVLAAPRLGCLNLHASLLPKYRGAAPINWAIIRGEVETGISLMQMDEGLDTGPVYTRHTLRIDSNENAGELSERLANLAAEVVVRDVPRVVAGQLAAVSQDPALASFAPPLTREHGRIDWSQAPSAITDLIRGLAPRPAAHSGLGAKSLRLLAARPLPEIASAAPGTVRVSEKSRLLVHAAHGAVEILLAQLEGKKVLAAPDLINGRILRDGDTLT